MAVLIRGGMVVDNGRSTRCDVRMENSLITQVGEELPEAGCMVVDAQGCLVFPGFIDAHTHLDMNTGATRTADDFDTGSRAALAGGTTTIIDFATQEKDGDLIQALTKWHTKADGVSSCDYAFHMAITAWNPQVQSQIAQMPRYGITSFKLYMAYDDLRINDAQLYQVLDEVRSIGGIAGAHCENGDLVNALTAKFREAGCLSPDFHPVSRPDIVEAEAVSRFLHIARLADVPVHIVHLSTSEAMEAVRAARERGQTVYVETCPHYLLLDDSRYRLPGFEGAKYVCSPPLRREKDIAALWEALGTGEIQSVSTDHCSFFFKGQKELGLHDFSKIPGGLPGIEHRPALLYTYGVCTGRITPGQMAALLSGNAARLFGMYPQKGAVRPGSDADLVIWDPHASGVIRAAGQQQQTDYTPYEGMSVTGAPRMVFLRGRKVAENGRLLLEKQGKYIFRQQYNKAL